MNSGPRTCPPAHLTAAVHRRLRAGAGRGKRNDDSPRTSMRKAADSACVATTWALCMALWPTPILATTVYRCGQTYQQVPCAERAASSGGAVNVADPRSEPQRRAARAAAAAEAARAEQLATERRAREPSAPQAAPMGIRAPQPAADAPASAAAGDASKGRRKPRHRADPADAHPPVKAPKYWPAPAGASSPR